MAGPLEGLRVVEMAGLGPGPLCGMVLSDLGANVVCISRPGVWRAPSDVTARGKRHVEIDLLAPGAADTALALIAQAHALIEGFRPGVMERLGLGPTTCHITNPRLVYGRVTGWGQTGPLSHAAGQDLNYIALSGALNATGRAGEPPPPPVGDHGGGAMLLAVGVLSALHAARSSGRGQVVDAAMSDGAALLASRFYGMKAAGAWSDQRGENLLDGGEPFYDTYACADGKFVAIGPLAHKSCKRLCDLSGLDDGLCAERTDRLRWPLLKLRLADAFRTRTRDEWCELLEGSEACFSPVLDWDEAPGHPHNQARGTFVTLESVVQPAPAPRFSATPAGTPSAAQSIDIHAALRAWAAAAATPAEV